MPDVYETPVGHVWTLCVFSLAEDRWIPIVRKESVGLVSDIAVQLRFAIVEPICVIETPDDVDHIEAFLLTIPKESHFAEFFIESWRAFEGQRFRNVEPKGSA